MTRLRKAVVYAVWLGAIYVMFPLPAHAYLDPGTGSLLLQFLAAALLAATYFVARFRAKIKAFFARIVQRRKQP